MSSILLTTDLSDESQRAFAPVARIAKGLGHRVTLLAVLEDMPFEPTAGGLAAPYPDRGRLRQDWQKQLELMAGRIEGVGVDCVVIDAMDVPRAIVDYAHREKVAMIAMATHGRTGLRRLLLGSVAETVLRHARVPVIVFPPPA